MSPSLKTRWKRLCAAAAGLFERVRNTGIAGEQDEVLVASIRMTNTLSLAFGIIILFVAPIIVWLTRSPAVGIPITVEFFINLSVIYLNHRKKHVVASMTVYFLQAAAITYFSLLLGEVLHMQFMVTFLISIIFLVFSKELHRKIAFGTAIGILVVVQACYFFDVFPSIPVSYNVGFTIQCLVIIGIITILSVVSKPYVDNNDWIHKIRRANRFMKIFTRQIVHELRNQLQSVHSVAQAMTMEIKLDNNLKKMAPYVDQLLAAVTSMRNIVNNVLEMAKIEAGKIDEIKEEAFELTDFFERLVGLHKFHARARSLRLKLAIDPSMPAVAVCDPVQLDQITTNLLNNAIKYAYKNTVVTLHVIRDGDFWKIRVVNKGLVIPADKQDAIFEQFETNKSSRFTEGTGLGLSLVKKKIEALGGWIALDSREGSDDIIFTVRLPLKAGRYEDIPQEAETIVDLSDIHVLIADDNEMNNLLFSRFLGLCGCKVTAVTNGREVMAELSAAKSQRLPDILLIDHQMPEMGGIEILQCISGDPALCHIPVIVCTGESEAIPALKLAGAAEVLVKPIDGQQTLIKAIGQHLPRTYEA